MNRTRFRFVALLLATLVTASVLAPALAHAESSLKGNSPGEYVWATTYLDFNAWSERRRVGLSYPYFQYWWTQ